MIDARAVRGLATGPWRLSPSVAHMAHACCCTMGDAGPAPVHTMRSQMPTLTAVAYLSSSTTLLSEAELEALLQQARTFNHGVGVTGVLLHHDGNFFQYFEGPEAGVSQVYDRICSSKRHHTIFELFRGPITQCFFGNWQMGFAQTPQSEILKLSQCEWKVSATAIGEIAQPSEGLMLLEQYWQSVAPWGGGH